MSRETFRVAALVSLYRAERFIRGRLEDLVGQTLFKRGELEIIVIDSASPENEYGAIREYCEKYPNIKYKRTKVRETLYKAWNRGIEMSEAPLLTNANADDRLCFDALEKLADALETNQEAGFAYGDAYLSSIENETFEEAGKDTVFRSQDYFGPDLLCHQFLGHQVMWRRALHRQVGLFSPLYKAAGDYEFMLRGAIRTRGVHVREPLGLLLRRRDSITFSDGTMNQEVTAVKKQFRNKEHVLELYKAEGGDVEKPGYPEACYVDMGNRALAYFPQWGSGRPDADFEFAQLCFDWALNSNSKNSVVYEVKHWARLNALSAGVLSGLRENGEEPAGVENGIDKTSEGLDITNKDGVTLYWPDLGLDQSCDHLNSVLGLPSPRNAIHNGGMGHCESTIDPYSYWAQLTGIDRKAAVTLRSNIRANQPLLIWGASARGVLILKVLDHFGFEVSGFVDNDPTKVGSGLSGITVVKFDPEEAIARDWKVILAVSEQQRDFILDQLDGFGMSHILLQV